MRLSVSRRSQLTNSMTLLFQASSLHRLEQGMRRRYIEDTSRASLHALGVGCVAWPKTGSGVRFYKGTG